MNTQRKKEKKEKKPKKIKKDDNSNAESNLHQMIEHAKDHTTGTA
jgi:hypothetical protein